MAQQICGCQNCKRKDPIGEDSEMAPYHLEFKIHPCNELIHRRTFRFVEIDRELDDLMVLCLESYEFLTNPDDKSGKSFKNTWPSFVWNVLTDEVILGVYGVHVWRFLPETWRYWWIDAVHRHGRFQDVTISTPSSIFKDITNDIGDMNSGLKTKTLSEIMRCCNKHLIPSVLCPWGEAEYIHKCGNLCYDLLIQRYLPKCFIQTISRDKESEKVYSSRDDYVRESLNDYEVLLLNPSWKVLPSV